MKKILIGIAAFLVLIFAVLIAIPLFFQGALTEKVKSAINKNINAEVNFGKLSISLIRDFPQARVSIEKLLVTGSGGFKGDTLLYLPSLRTKTTWGALFKKGDMSIEEIVFEKPFLNLLADAEGNANWDIAKPSQPEETAQPAQAKSQSEGFKLNLEKIIVDGADIRYTDHSMPMSLSVSGTGLVLSGKMYGDSTNLEVEGQAAHFSLTYDSATYISDVSLKIKSLLGIVFSTMKITVKNNQTFINQLPAEISGFFSYPSDTMFFGLEFASQKAGLKEFLSLIPPDYQSYLKDVETEGNASLSGFFKGTYIGEEYPAFRISMAVDNGKIHYPGLPESIKNITADALADKPQGPLELTSVEIKKAHAEIRNNPVNLALKTGNLFTDPSFEGSIAGKVNLSDIKNVLPLDSLDISGEVDANISFGGNLSAIENKTYDKLKTQGSVNLNEFVYNSAELKQPVRIPSGKLDFSPAAIRLSEMKINIGQSSLNLSGAISDYWNYFLKNGILKGTMKLDSRYLSLDELMSLQSAPAGKTPAGQKPSNDSAKDETPASQNLAFTVPENIDIDFNSAIAEASFGQLRITDINGLVTAKNGVLELNGLDMKLFGGEMNMKGSYKNQGKNQPLFDFGFDIKNFDLPTAAAMMPVIKRIVSSPEKSQGKLSSAIKISGQLTPSFGVVASTIDGSGFLSTSKILISDSPTLNQLSGILKKEKLKNISVDDFTANLNVEKGNLLIKPFQTKIAGQEATIACSLNTQDILDMKMDFTVNRDAFGPEIESILNLLPGQERITAVPVAVALTGPVKKPEVKLDLAPTRKYIAGEVKKSSSEDLKKSLDKLGKGLKKLLNQ